MVKYIVIVGCLVVLITTLALVARKMIGYKSSNVRENVVDLLVDLKDIDSFKINIVPAGELYSHYFGLIIAFLAYYISVVALGTVIANSGLYQGFIEGVLFIIFYLLIACMLLWYFSFFKKAIAPNMKHGDLIVKKLNRLIVITLTIVALAVWISAAFHLVEDHNRWIGTMIPGLFAGYAILIGVPSMVVRFELRRAGIPHLLENIKSLMRRGADKGNSNSRL